jgi:hypothetical protein
MSEALRNSDDTIENEEMTKLQALLEDQSNGIDTIKYASGYVSGKKEISLVPYRIKLDEKGFGSFNISEDDFKTLKSIFSDLSYVYIGNMNPTIPDKIPDKKIQNLNRNHKLKLY